MNNKQIALALCGLLSVSFLNAQGPVTTYPSPPSHQAAMPQNPREQELAATMPEAAKAANDYVALLDQGKYADSWSEGARVFQSTISQSEWVTALKLARQPLGRVKSRTLKDQKPAWDPAGLPRGSYMVLEYNTSFEGAPNSGELLTLMREPNGKWKVLTYQVN